MNANKIIVLFFCITKAYTNSSSSTLRVAQTTTNQNHLMTPCIEINSQSCQFKTPMNIQQQNTPITNNYRRNCTPQLNNTTLSTILNVDNLSETAAYEQMSPEYSLDCMWTEPSSVGVSGDAGFNERASKFFCIVDLYAQKYVCYLVPSKNQLRCIKIDYNYNMDCVAPTGLINYIPARDAVFVESRNLMVILDNQGSMFAYSGVTKLCKLQLHNIVWCNPSMLTAAVAPTQAPPAAHQPPGLGNTNRLIHVCITY